MKKHLLMILDGYGIAEDPSVSAIDHAKKPFLDSLFARYPHSTLDASGLAVGLPEGQMGNSEVGHMNLGAGRVVYQDMTRIDEAIRDGSFFANEVLVEALEAAKKSGQTVHVLGLLSDGGVHSHINHLFAVIKLAASKGFDRTSLAIHAFTDGRDTSPHGGKAYLADLEAYMAKAGCGHVASVVGRYWAMDRDHRWPRIKKAYDLLVEGIGTRYATSEEAIDAAYAAGTTDEFVEPCLIGAGAIGTGGIGSSSEDRIKPNDTVLFINFRADRARQITHALLDESFDGFERERLTPLHYVSFAQYEGSFSNPVAFPKLNLTHTLGQVIEEAGFEQLRAAETEKYPHVTYFFNGGRETPFTGEDRILVASPKVATYDLQPEMSAPELASKVAAAIQAKEYALVVINFANPDMVGHTGVMEAAIKAVEAVDAAAKVVVDAALESGYSVNIIADHGNSDRMRNPDGTPHTAHTTVPVPHLIIQDGFLGPIQHGKLGDIAPTILALLGIEKPESMTGKSLI
jgi:2,3-bisphosphoglycerate-independent phosphoglycerate mutase